MEKHDLDDTHLGENTHSRCPLGGHKNVPKSETHDTLEIRNVAAGSFHQEMLASNYLICFFVSTRSYAALRAADLDWIVGPGYSLGGYILKKNHGNHPKTMKTMKSP